MTRRPQTGWLIAVITITMLHPFAWASEVIVPDLCAANTSHDISSSNQRRQSPPTQPLTLLGIANPAIVSGAISVSVSGADPGQFVTYCLDNHAVWLADRAPWGFGSVNSAGVIVFPLRALGTGPHTLLAIASSPDGSGVRRSSPISLTVIQPDDRAFSPSLKPYPLQASLQQTPQSIVHLLETSGSVLTPAEQNIRLSVAAMYLNFGFDLASDHANDLSGLLPKLLPAGWMAPSTSTTLPLSMRFSPDSSFYKTIPSNWPRILLPPHLIHTVQVNSNQGGDGIGFGEVVATSASPIATVTGKWYDDEATATAIKFPVPSGWQSSLPRLESGDRHLIFIDPARRTFVSLYKASAVSSTSAPHALYAAPPTSFNTLGDSGGSVAARFAELPLLIQPGEATADDQDIHHAIGGPIRRVWAGRVYPATARDYGMMTAKDSSCSENVPMNTSLMNTGLVPYGGIIQLDPALDLQQFHLSRPAFRILRAMQLYGFYVMDFGCADLDIYTAIPESELNPWGGLYGNGSKDHGIQNEVQNVVTTSNLYVVAPLTKRP